MISSLSPFPIRPLFAIQLSSSPDVAHETLLTLILGSDPITKAVLVFLIFLSLVSWGIMLLKWRTFRTAEARARDFVHDFERARDVDEAVMFAQRAKPSAFTVVFNRAVQFLNETKPAMAATADRNARLSGSQVEALHLVLESEGGREREALGSYIPWLATVGSVSPLIGLLGTVLGVISAFAGIFEKGSGNISAVAPGIAIALVATAAALAVAIPAAFSYNIFAARLNRYDNSLDGFSSELIALLVREGRI